MRVEVEKHGPRAVERERAALDFAIQVLQRVAVVVANIGAHGLQRHPPFLRLTSEFDFQPTTEQKQLVFR